GVTASALFVAPAAAALGLAGGWSPDLARSRRFLLGLLPIAYLFGAAWLVGSGTHGAQALAQPAPVPMPGVPRMLAQTWGPWSTPVLLVAMLSAWAFVGDHMRARYFAAGAFFFLLVAIDPYTTPLFASLSVGAKTYWRLTWALPLPFFLAVVVEGLLARALAVRPVWLAGACCVALAASAAWFVARTGTLACTNGVTVGAPGPKVPAVEYATARQVALRTPEAGTVLAPEAVAIWLPGQVVHPQLIGVRHLYLSLAFPPAETAQRSNLMRFVAGTHRPPGAEAWFRDSLHRHGLTAIVYDVDTVLWHDQIERILLAEGWRPLSRGRYTIMVRGDVPGPPAQARPR
ncbi:hypothetical protein QAA18_11780, partial [Luteimonas sp. 8-5]|uniref:hypothetical protein n=1 Tax=Luteimonas sp. 8-5 TaxID=3039387 RepID=UPI00243635AC